VRLSGRSFVAFVLAPEAPLADWIASLDAFAGRSPGFFATRPVILDLSRVPPDAPLPDLLALLRARGVHVVGLEGVDASRLGPGAPPSLGGGRPAAVATPAEPEIQPAEAAPRRSLVVDGPIRSGQSLVHLEGDVTVVGSVASGAEVIAGGSVHVYGALRGRALAGAGGDGAALIYATRLEAELLAIDGYFMTADDIPQAVLGGAAAARLSNEAIRVSVLDG